MQTDIDAYIAALPEALREAAVGLQSRFNVAIPGAEAKVWHGHPVWFVEGNPIAGFSEKKAGIEVLFWSGQSFRNAGLKPVGKYQAASLAIDSSETISSFELKSALEQCLSVQWDYKNLVKNRGTLAKLTDF